MWKIDKFNLQCTNAWFNNYIACKFMRYEKPIVIPNTPFDIEVTVNVYNDLKRNGIYVYNEEKGGIIFCKLITEPNQVRLQTFNIEEVPNIYKPTKDKPGRDKSNTYKPDSAKYKALIGKNFSKTDYGSILFPIHFHTHPTKDKEEALEYFRQYSELNTSSRDREAANERFLEFGCVKFRYLNAIITGHKNEHNILFYAKDITPLNFMLPKFKRIQGRISEFGKGLSELSKDENTQTIIKSLVELIGTSIVAFNYNIVDYATDLFEDKEYFGSLNQDKSTIFKIPLFV